MASVRITGPLENPGNLVLSDWVSYMTEETKPTDRFWFALPPDHGPAVGGLKLRLQGGGATARDITGVTVGVSELSVDPKYQRQGVAEALMKATESWVMTQPNIPRTMGLGVETDNYPAISLYKKLGYVIAAHANQAVTFKGPDGKPCYVMYKQLMIKSQP